MTEPQNHSLVRGAHPTPLHIHINIGRKLISVIKKRLLFETVRLLEPWYVQPRGRLFKYDISSQVVKQCVQ